MKKANRVHPCIGQTVHSRTIDDLLLKGENTIDYLPADNLSSGIYLFRISGENVEINGKFTLLR